MAVFKAHKVVSTLPLTLEEDTIYLVRTGVGFDLYCSDTTGSIAYKINPLTATEVLDALKTVDGAGSGLNADLLDGLDSSQFSLSTSNVEIIIAQKNLVSSDAKYQFLSCATPQAVNLPNPSTATNKEFIIVNTGTVDIELKENNVTTNVLLGEGGRATCYSTGSAWEVFLDYEISGQLNETSLIDGGVF